MDKYELAEIRKRRREHELQIEYQRRLVHQEQLEHERRMEEERQQFEQDLEDERQKFNEEQEKERQTHAEELLEKQERLRKLAAREAESVCYAANGEKLLGTYDGELCNGLPSGEGKFYFDNGDSYIGGFLGGKFHGQGKLIRRKGEVRYEGEWEVGSFHGIGTYYYSNGDIKQRKTYSGSFFRGLRQGRGILTWLDDTRYEGEFLQNEMHGQGVMTWSCGDRYEGLFANGQREGKGKYTSCDGFCYDGSWKAGMRHGKGTLAYLDGWSTTAEWQNDKPYNGQFRQYTNQVIEYDGEYINGKREGSGVLYHKNGNKIYTGSWENNLYSGKGVLHHYVGDELAYTAEGIFEKGKLRKGSYQDGEYMAKGDFDENGLFLSGELYKNGTLFISGNVNNKKFDIHFDGKVFHTRPIFGLTELIGVDDADSTYLLVEINSFTHHKHNGNNFDNIFIRKCDIVGDYVTDGRPNEWLYARDGSGYLQLDSKTDKGELHFTSNQPSVLMQNYGVQFKDNIHFILCGRFKYCQPEGECVLTNKSKTFSEHVTYDKGKRNGKFKWDIKADSWRTVTGLYHNGIMSPIGEISYRHTRFGTNVIKKYKGEINQCGLPNGLGKMFWTQVISTSPWNEVERCKYGKWENGECVKELSSLAYLFYTIKK